MIALPLPSLGSRRYSHTATVLSLCLTALLAQGEAAALGADAPRSSEPAAADKAAAPDTANAKSPKAKPKATGPRTAGAGNPADRCAAPSRIELFEPGRTYRLQARRGYVSEIHLGAGDGISVPPAGGDTDGWDVDSTIGSAVVTVKPRHKAENSNLILQAAGRSYLIALDVIPEHSPCKGEWQLSFQLPAPPVVLMAEPPALVAAREARALREATQEVPVGRNWSYSMQALPGSDDIVPTEVYDDGRFTFIRIPGNRELPSVFRISSDGTESFVERHMEGRDVMVVHDVSRQWVLRLDKQTVGLWNEAFDIEGIPPVAGARSDRIQRVIRGGEQL